MDTPSEPAAQPRRLSVGFKLGAVFLLLVTLATGNLYLVGKGYDSIANVAGIINQSGQLRYLSQQITSVRLKIKQNHLVIGWWCNDSGGVGLQGA